MNPFTEAYSQLTGQNSTDAQDPQDFSGAYAAATGSQDTTNAIQPFSAAYTDITGASIPPQDVMNAQAEVGQPIDQGYCEQFASRMTDGKNWGDTAYDAFKNQVDAGHGVVTPDVSEAPVGSKIYFAPDNSNGGNGHVGILVDDRGDFISADYDKVSMNNLNTWKQTPIGYVPGGKGQ